jgi:serine/threonine protein kinase
MPAPLDCPGIEGWQALFGDTIPPQERENYERHLESCPVCQALLDRASRPDDDLLRLVRQSSDLTVRPADPSLTAVLQRLHEWKSPLQGAPVEPMDLYFLRPTDRPGLLGTLGDYEVQEAIGQGGFGVVLKAYEPALHRLVAIKVLSPALAGSATARRRFSREARAAAAVSHDHVVAVYGVNETDGLPYLVMQFVAGESLQARLDRTGPLEVMDVVRIGMQTAAGLAAAHAQGLIHRDVKPANLLLENGLARVKITDFGLARMADDVGLTQSGVVAGTPEYMAPEQARGEVVDHRADLFSLGSVLYACGTGTPPFRGSTALAVLRRVSEGEPKPIRSVNPEVPAWLEALVARLMAKDPDRRFQTAAEVAALLEGYLAHLAQPATVPAPALVPFPLPLPEQGDVEMSFPCSGCGTNLKARREQAGKRVKCPQCGTLTRVPRPAPAVAKKAPLSTSKRLLIAFGALLLVLFGIWACWPRRSPQPSYLDVILGHRSVAGVEDSGFYHDEENDLGPFRWTDGQARLVIPLNPREPPTGLLVQLQRPRSTWLRLTVNGRELVNEPAAEEDMRRWERTLDLGGIDLGDKLVVEITSSTVVPRELKPDKSEDARPLGVTVRGVRLLRQTANESPVPAGRSFLGVTLGNRPVPGVKESGFHQDEGDRAGRPFRWTAGHARLVVPLDRAAPPQALWVHLDRPKGTSLKIVVNDRELVSEPACERDVWWWDRTLDLSGIDAGDSLVVEVASNVVAVRERDTRRLGVRLRGIELLGEDGVKALASTSFLDVPLGGQFVRGVAESGFLDQEKWPPATFCRWTNGPAHLTVPLHGQKPRALALSAFLPRAQGSTREDSFMRAGQMWSSVAQGPLIQGIGAGPVPYLLGVAESTLAARPGYWVQVTVNGTRLFDGRVPARGVWSCELPLSRVDLGESAHIELNSSMFVPAEVEPGNRDTRVLGIRLIRLTLRTESATDRK